MNRHPHRNLSVEEAVAVVTLAETGLSQRYIGHRLGVNQSTVSRVLKRHRETQEYSRRPGQGRKRVVMMGGFWDSSMACPSASNGKVTSRSRRSRSSMTRS
jgi:hypothetical protein